MTIWHICGAVFAVHCLMLAAFIRLCVTSRDYEDGDE